MVLAHPRDMALPDALGRRLAGATYPSSASLYRDPPLGPGLFLVRLQVLNPRVRFTPRHYSDPPAEAVTTGLNLVIRITSPGTGHNGKRPA